VQLLALRLLVGAAQQQRQATEEEYESFSLLLSLFSGDSQLPTPLNP
jgi:hypothetical protein